MHKGRKNLGQVVAGGTMKSRSMKEKMINCVILLRCQVRGRQNCSMDLATWQ